jgi:hypothetical protein
MHDISQEITQLLSSYKPVSFLKPHHKGAINFSKYGHIILHAFHKRGRLSQISLMCADLGLNVPGSNVWSDTLQPCEHYG